MLMHTLDGVHVGRKRRSSDASFGCVGVDMDGVVDRYQVFDGDDEYLVPKPLFSCGK
jgi:hypothetical protein